MSGGVPAGELLPVEQCDREAAARMHDMAFGIGNEYAPELRQGLHDVDAAVQAFAAHRIAATPTPPIEGRDADVEREARELLAQAYERANLICPAADVRAKNKIDWVREAVALDAIRAALQALGERP